jgi:hypothetical protein
MKNKPATRRAFAALVPATLLLAVPGYAQEIQPAAPAAPPVQQTVAPPPVVPTIAPPAAAVAPPLVTAAPTVTAEMETPAPAATARTTRTVTRSTRVVRAPAPAPVRAAPAPVAAAPVPTPAEVTPAPVTPAPVEAAAPAPVPAQEVVTQGATETQGAPIWPWLVAGLVALIAVAGFLVMRRRRVEDEEFYYEEPYVEEHAVEAAPIRSEPAPFAPDAEPQFLRTAPLAAAAVLTDEPAPVAAEDATLVKPEAEEVASLTEGEAPVADRPWLEMSLRPVRAGTNVDEALVEIELTIGNSGSVAAEDVRISTFMFASQPANGTDMERMLIERGDDGVPLVTIRPGEGTRVDATLALSKAELIESTDGSILPIIVADARYTLPDGSEGRTSASFTIGVSEEGGPEMAPIQLNERAMHDDVEARLHGVPEHA